VWTAIINTDFLLSSMLILVFITGCFDVDKAIDAICCSTLLLVVVSQAAIVLSHGLT
jgi:hypothetical protein